MNMASRFKIHYTPAEARVLLPEVRVWLEELGQLATKLGDLDGQISPGLQEGRDMGGDAVHQRIEVMARLSTLMREFSSREIQIKDVDRGLIDFPALLDGREVFLCWEKSEDDISFWHSLEEGYTGRQPLLE